MMKRALGVFVLAIAATVFAVAALTFHSTTPKSPIVQQVVPAGAPQKQGVPTPVVQTAKPGERVYIDVPSSGATLRPCTPPECHSTP